MSTVFRIVKILDVLRILKNLLFLVLDYVLNVHLTNDCKLY